MNRLRVPAKVDVVSLTAPELPIPVDIGLLYCASHSNTLFDPLLITSPRGTHAVAAWRPTCRSETADAESLDRTSRVRDNGER